MPFDLNHVNLAPRTADINHTKARTTPVSLAAMRRLKQLGCSVIGIGSLPDTLPLAMKSALIEQTKEGQLVYLEAEQSYLVVTSLPTNRNYSMVPIHAGSDMATVHIFRDAESLLSTLLPRATAGPVGSPVSRSEIPLTLVEVPRELELSSTETATLEALASGAKRGLLANDGVVNSWAQLQATDPTLNALPDSQLYRGYLQVNYQQIPRAVEILTRFFELRRNSLKFKFLVGRWFPEDIETGKVAVGRYVQPDPAAPVIVLYGLRKEDILDVLTGLAETSEWAEIDADRQASGIENRRSGTNALSHNGRWWKTLCYNDGPGYSESVVDRAEADSRDWHEDVRGPRTQRNIKIV